MSGRYQIFIEAESSMKEYVGFYDDLEKASDKAVDLENNEEYVGWDICMVDCRNSILYTWKENDWVLVGDVDDTEE